MGIENLKKLDNCALCFKRKVGKDGKAHDNMYVLLPNGKAIQVKQAFYNSNELYALKTICGVNVPQETNDTESNTEKDSKK